MCEHRKTVCAGCGCEGYRAETTAGEYVENGAVVGAVPDGATALLAGLADGSRTDDAFCDACAEGKKPQYYMTSDHAGHEDGRIEACNATTLPGAIAEAKDRYVGGWQGQTVTVTTDKGRVWWGYVDDHEEGATSPVIRYTTANDDRWGDNGFFTDKEDAIRAAMHAWNMSREEAEEFVDETLCGVNPEDVPAHLEATSGGNFTVFTEDDNAE